MNRYIVLAFAVMALAYWLLSGGAEFEPDVRDTIASVQAEAPTGAGIAPAPAAAPPVAEVARAEVRSAPSTYISPAITTEPQTVVLAPSATPTRDDAPRASAPAADLTTTAAPAQDGPILQGAAGEDEPVTFVSLASPGESAPTAPRFDGSEATAASSNVAGDLRRVDAGRLNVRAGPSTQNGVIDQVARGDEVLVVETDGSWSRIRVEGDGVTGWVASRFLVP